MNAQLQGDRSVRKRIFIGDMGIAVTPQGVPLEDLRAPAVAANREIYSDIANLQAITRYIEKGLFPWEPSAVSR